jgi:pyruvate kinase
MASIITQTEAASLEEYIGRRLPLSPLPEIDDTIAYLAATATRHLKVQAIITFTMSGSTALRVSKFRPEVPIFAVTPLESTRLRLALARGTISADTGRARSIDQMLKAAIAAAKECGIVKRGDTVVVTAGVPFHTRGNTNLLKLEAVE